jgi:hypothetical protein
MNRIVDVAVEEFPEISPPRLVFVLEWVKHRYMVEIDDISNSPRPPAKPEVKAAPIVCKI